MRRGARFLITVAGLAVAAACSQQGKLDIRSRPAAMVPGDRVVPERIAEARGQLALGNVALALESFRKAAREDPSNIDALTGMAACYEHMGRYELSRAKYEAALALAPGDRALLKLLEASWRHQGELAKAEEIRRELTLLGSGADTGIASTGGKFGLAPGNTAAQVGNEAHALPIPQNQIKAPALRMQTVAVGRADAEAPVRLERISMAEVALVRARPAEALVVARPSTIDITALPAAREVRILNAARIHALAARTRDWLVQRGWPALSVSDAEAVLPDSVIYYPANKRRLAERLSFEFGFPTVERKSAREVTVMLGRDVTRKGHPGVGRLAVTVDSNSFLGVSSAPFTAWAGIARQASHAIEAGRTDQARAMIGRAVTAGAPPLVTSRLVADLTYRTGEYEVAAGLYEALMKIWRDDLLIAERAGMSRFHLKQYEVASRHLEKATSEPGASWQAWNALGAAADARRDWQMSDAAYRRALFLAPRRGEILNNLGWSLALRGRWREAREVLEQAVAVQPGLKLAARNLELARAALDHGLPRRGARESDTAWSGKLNDAGVVALNQGNVAKAISAFARAIETRGQWFQRAVNNLRVAERGD